MTTSLKKPPTVRQYIGRATVRYRARYSKMLVPETPYGRFERPEYMMPRADHAFQLGPYLVSRPYRLWEYDIRDLSDWAEKHGLRLRIDAPSSWHPATLVVVANRPEFACEYREGAKQYGDAFESTLITTEYYEMFSAVHRVRHKWREGETGMYVLEPSRSRHGVGDVRNDVGVEHYVKAQKGYTIGNEE